MVGTAIGMETSRKEELRGPTRREIFLGYTVGLEGVQVEHIWIKDMEESGSHNRRRRKDQGHRQRGSE